MNSYKVLFITLLLPVWPEATSKRTISADFFFYHTPRDKVSFLVMQITRVLQGFWPEQN